jgi:hypothetical protein
MHELKINGCAICGFDECDMALDFHHVDGTTKLFHINVSSLYRYSNEKIATELTKCILLCKNHHSVINAKDIFWNRPKKRLSFEN